MSGLPDVYEKVVFGASGYAIFGRALTAEQVKQARADLTTLFEGPPDLSWGDSALVRTNLMSRFPSLRALILQPSVMEPLRLLLGDGFAILPDNTATHSRYSGWHKDTHGFERFGYNFHREPDYLCLTCLIYLQDNDADYGGGLEVVPGSHLVEDRYRHAENPATHARLYKLGEAAYPPEVMSPVPSRAGDLVVFNDKLDHAGTWPKSEPRPSSLYDAPPPALAPDKRKFMFAFGAMPNGPYVSQYMDYFRFLKNKFHEYQAVGRAGYSPDVLSHARSLGATLLAHE